jgi:hypothetical protein
LNYANDSERILTILVTSTKWSKASMPMVLQLSFVILTRVVAFYAITSNHDDNGYSTVETRLQPVQMHLYSCQNIFKLWLPIIIKFGSGFITILE